MAARTVVPELLLPDFTPNISPLELTDGGSGEAASVFTTGLMNVANFNTQFFAGGSTPMPTA